MKNKLKENKLYYTLYKLGNMYIKTLNYVALFIITMLIVVAKILLKNNFAQLTENVFVTYCFMIAMIILYTLFICILFLRKYSSAAQLCASLLLLVVIIMYYEINTMMNLMKFSLVLFLVGVAYRSIEIIWNIDIFYELLNMCSTKTK